MASLDLILYQELESDITEQLQRLATELVAGKATSYEDYRFRVGRIQGYNDALKLAREAQDRVIGVEEHRKR